MNAETKINNTLYDELGSKWYEAKDNPVALLRAESRVKNPWIAQKIDEALGIRSCEILDIGCGGGFLSNDLALKGHAVVGIDLSAESLAVAKNYDSTQSVRYQQADAYALPFAQQSFDVVTAMDFLEHVEKPAQVIREAARVLRPGGLFFFHTFNQNLVAGFLVIKGLEWLVKNTPPRMHLYRLFIKPKVVREYCEHSLMNVQEMVGIKPKVFHRPFFESLLSGEVHSGFTFELTPSLLISYMGYARKYGPSESLERP